MGKGDKRTRKGKISKGSYGENGLTIPTRRKQLRRPRVVRSVRSRARLLSGAPLAGAAA